MSAQEQKPRSDDRPSAIFVTDVPLSHSFPAGFSSRVLHLIDALGERMDTRVISLRRASQALPSAGVPKGASSIIEMDIDAPPRTKSEQVRRALGRLCSTHPSFSRARVVTRAVQGEVERHRPDVVILHLPYLAHLARRFDRLLPVVFLLEEAWERIHNTVPTSLAGRVGNGLDLWRVPRLYRWIGERAATVGVISEAERMHFSRFMERDRIVVYPHGVDTDRFAPTSNCRDIDVLIVGDMRQERNLAPVMDLLEVADEDGRRWWIVGPTRAPNPSQHGNVTWTGMVDAVEPFYARARVAAVPTRDGTGVKGTLLQAWSCGVPVVASPFAARSVGATAGLDVLVGDAPGEMRRQIAAVLSDDGLHAALARQGRRRALERDVRSLSGAFADHVVDVVVGK